VSEAKCVDRDHRRHAEVADVADVAGEVGEALLDAATFSLPISSMATPPCILSARMVATITAADGASPALRHLMSKNFSAPRSAPKPASVTT
jgi:hypothetical protein